MRRPLIFRGTTNRGAACFIANLASGGEGAPGRIEESVGGKGADQAAAAGRLQANPNIRSPAPGAQHRRAMPSMAVL